MKFGSLFKMRKKNVQIVYIAKRNYVCNSWEKNCIFLFDFWVLNMRWFIWLYRTFISTKFRIITSIFIQSNDFSYKTIVENTYIRWKNTETLSEVKMEITSFMTLVKKFIFIAFLLNEIVRTYYKIIYLHILSFVLHGNLLWSDRGPRFSEFLHKLTSIEKFNSKINIFDFNGLHNATYFSFL